MGDVLFTMPIVADLARAYPGATIDWAVDQRFSDLPKQSRLVNRVYELPLRDYQFRKIFSLLAVLSSVILKIRKLHYDIVVDLQGMTKSAAITGLSGARRRWGYSAKEMAEPLLSFLYTDHFRKERGYHPVIRYRREVAQLTRLQASVPVDFAWRQIPPKSINFPIESQATASERVAVVFPFASKENKKIPEPVVEKIIDTFIERGFSILIPSGNSDEWRLAGQWCGRPEVARLPAQSLVDLMGIIAACRCFVGADTGLTHLATALQRPTLAVFVSTLADRFGPHLWADHAHSLHVDDTEFDARLSASLSGIVLAGSKQ